jgi:hypothetical protein
MTFPQNRPAPREEYYNTEPEEYDHNRYDPYYYDRPRRRQVSSDKLVPPRPAPRRETYHQKLARQQPRPQEKKVPVMPIMDAVKEKIAALNKTRIYLIVGIVIIFVMFGYPHFVVAGVGICAFMVMIMLNQMEINRLNKKYLK